MREHYDHFPIQPFEMIRSAGFGFFSGNVVKYITRHPHKNGVEDLKKAVSYLNYMLENGVRDYAEPVYHVEPKTYIKANHLGKYEAQALIDLIEWRITGARSCLQDVVKSIEKAIEEET